VQFRRLAVLGVLLVDAVKRVFSRFAILLSGGETYALSECKTRGSSSVRWGFC